MFIYMTELTSFTGEGWLSSSVWRVKVPCMYGATGIDQNGNALLPNLIAVLAVEVQNFSSWGLQSVLKTGPLRCVH